MNQRLDEAMNRIIAEYATQRINESMISDSSSRLIDEALYNLINGSNIRRIGESTTPYKYIIESANRLIFVSMSRSIGKSTNLSIHQEINHPGINQ